MAEGHEVMGRRTARIGCKAARGRKTANAATFTGRDDNDGAQVQACGHEHATQAGALACAKAEASAIVAGALPGCEPPGLEALRRAMVAEFGMPVEWGGPWD